MIYINFLGFLFWLTSSLFGYAIPSLPHAIVGGYVVDRKTEQVLLDHHSQLSFIPASCMKVITTATALSVLPQDYRFETDLEYDGYIDTGILYGHLYIKGKGDPCLGSDRISGSVSWQQQIATWVKAIQQLGIHTITGKVMADISAWETALAVPSWSWEDIGNYYGSGASALSFHENSYTVFFKPGQQEGDPAQILRTEPPLASYLTLLNEVKTGPVASGDQASIYGCEHAFVQIIRGTIPAAVEEFAIKGALPQPAYYCTTLLSEALKNNNIFVQQQDLPQHFQRTLLHRTYSPSLAQIVYVINQKSLNLYAEHLLKQIGKTIYQEGSTKAGTQAVTTFWQSKGISLEGFSMKDGSGLSRQNLVTPQQLVSILLKMQDTTSFPLFFASLPQQNSFVHAKSGSMNLIKGYAGYTENLAFAVLVNQSLDASATSESLLSFLCSLN